MIFDIDMIREVYSQLPEKIEAGKKETRPPLNVNRKNFICAPFAWSNAGKIQARRRLR